MFKRLIGSSSKKGKSKSSDSLADPSYANVGSDDLDRAARADGSVGSNNGLGSGGLAAAGTAGAGGERRGRAGSSASGNSALDGSPLRLGENGGGGGGHTSSGPSRGGGGGKAQPAKIERQGGLSRHESPLPSPSSSSTPGPAAPSGFPQDRAASPSDSFTNGSSTAGAGGAGGAFNHPGMLRRDSHTNDSLASSHSAPGGNNGAAGIPTTHTILSSGGRVDTMSGSASSGMGGFGGGGMGGGGGGVAGGQSSNSLGTSAGAAAANDQVRTFDIDDMISRLIEAGYANKIPKPALKNAEITAVCQAAREIFLSQPTLIELSPPVKIVGDTHGQYQDLLRLFEMCGFPPHANYLFLGDYVDRGKQSLETILLLLCYKIKYPENFFLLRGNHECANVTRVYGFYDECKRRVNIKIWKTFIDVFNTLPIAAVVASKIFCVHGGLSPSLSNMDDIRRIERPTDVPDYGLLNDLLWSDPSDTALDWEDNERGVSYCFGKAVIQQFLGQYDFDLICRAHMVVEDGYEFWNERTLVTIFSAPNYCGEFDNFGAVMSVSEDLLCAFELLKPLDGAALKKEMAKNKRRSLMQHQSPAARGGGSY